MNIVLRRLGGVDILINNAGIHYDRWEQATNADWTIIREAFDTNVFGAWRLSQLLAEPMRRQGWGRIVNVEVAGLCRRARRACYGPPFFVMTDRVAGSSATGARCLGHGRATFTDTNAFVRETVRHLSPSIAPKRKFLAVDLTICPACPEKNPHHFSCLYVPETIERE